MARPREFDEAEVLDAAVQCFWARGYEATSIRDLIEKTGVTGASSTMPSATSALYHKALDHYVEGSIAARIRRCEGLTPRAALAAFFDEILERSLSDPQHKGCMLVNAALDVAPHDPAFKDIVAGMLSGMEEFFRPPSRKARPTEASPVPGPQRTSRGICCAC